mgnify:CR=1 FL=1
MHQYLKAIGFGSLRGRKELNELLDKTRTDFSHHELVGQEDEMDFCEYQKEYGAGIGIAVMETWISMSSFICSIIIRISSGQGLHPMQMFILKSGWIGSLM